MYTDTRVKHSCLHTLIQNGHSFCKHYIEHPICNISYFAFMKNSTIKDLLDSDRDVAIYFFFGLLIGTFEVIVIYFVKFFVACLMSEILNDKKDSNRTKVQA